MAVVCPVVPPSVCRRLAVTWDRTQSLFVGGVDTFTGIKFNVKNVDKIILLVTCSTSYPHFVFEALA